MTNRNVPTQPLPPDNPCQSKPIPTTNHPRPQLSDPADKPLPPQPPRSPPPPFGAVAQRIRAPAYGAGCRGFDSHRPLVQTDRSRRIHAVILAERRPLTVKTICRLTDDFYRPVLESLRSMERSGEVVRMRKPGSRIEYLWSAVPPLKADMPGGVVSAETLKKYLDH